MRYCDYDRCGIHSRLQHIINKSGGYNVRLASELLMKEYGINNSEIAYEMAKNERMRDEIEAVGLEAVIDLTRKSIALRNIRFESCMNFYKRMIM